MRLVTAYVALQAYHGIVAARLQAHICLPDLIALAGEDVEPRDSNKLCLELSASPRTRQLSPLWPDSPTLSLGNPSSSEFDGDLAV